VGSSTSASAPSSFAPEDSAGKTPTPTAFSASAGTSAALSAPLSALVASRASLQGCLTAVEEGAKAGEHPVAVDAGTYDGQPALVVVVLTAETSTTFDVFIVSPACSATDAHLIAFHSVKRS